MLESKGSGALAIDPHRRSEGAGDDDEGAQGVEAVERWVSIALSEGAGSNDSQLDQPLSSEP